MLRRVLGRRAASGLSTRLRPAALRRGGEARHPRNTAAAGKHDDVEEARGFLRYLWRRTRQKSSWYVPLTAALTRG